jgi:hypothetical protein
MQSNLYAGGLPDTGLKLKVRIRYECEATSKITGEGYKRIEDSSNIKQTGLN